MVREALGWDEKKLSELFECSESTISDYEAGNIPIEAWQRRELYKITSIDVCPMDGYEDPQNILPGLARIKEQNNALSDTGSK